MAFHRDVFRALEAAFPDAEFKTWSTNSHCEGCVVVRWADGPTVAAVEASLHEWSTRRAYLYGDVVPSPCASPQVHLLRLAGPAGTAVGLLLLDDPFVFGTGDDCYTAASEAVADVDASLAGVSAQVLEASELLMALTAGACSFVDSYEVIDTLRDIGGRDGLLAAHRCVTASPHDGHHHFEPTASARS